MTRWWPGGYVAEVDDDQLAALRRLPAAFGFVAVVEVASNDPAAAPAARSDEGDARGGEPSVHGECLASALVAVLSDASDDARLG
jgi:hypothetical protein